MRFILNRTALVRLRALIKAGKFIDRPWKFTAADSNALLGDDNWTDYGMWFLGKTDSRPARSKSSYEYPFGKGASVFLSALRLTVKRARFNGDYDIAREAQKALDLAARKTADRMRASRVIAFSAPLKIKASTDDAGEPKGPPTFSMVAYTGGKMLLDGWEYPVVVDLEGVEGIDVNRPALRDHDQGRVVGHTTDIHVDDGELVAGGVISGSGPDAQEVTAAGLNGFPWQASIGANVVKNEFIPAGQQAMANGRTFSGPLNIARRTAIGEISFVALGADDNTSARVAALAAKENRMDFEAWLSAKGFKAEDLSDAQCKAMRAMYDDEQDSSGKGKTADSPDDNDPDDDEDDEDDDAGDAPDGGDDSDDDDDEDDEDDEDADAEAKKAKAKGARARRAHAGKRRLAIRARGRGKGKRVLAHRPLNATSAVKELRAAHARESRRIAAINQIAGGQPEIAAKAIEKGWDKTRTELEVLRASRPKVETSDGSFAIHSRGGMAIAASAYSAAGALSAGISEKVALEGLDDRTKEVATSRPMRGIGLHGIMAAVAASHGIPCHAGGINNDFIRRLLHAERNLDIRAEGGAGGFSTMSLSGITENILNKAMLEAYSSVESVVPDICYETDTNDFKQFKRYRLTASGTMQPVGPDGELKSMSLQDESYANQVSTQGVIITVTRVILINDDMGALTQIPTVIGRQAGLSREKIVFFNLLGNAGSFFSSGNNNYLSGSGSALGLDALSSAVQLFRQQRDANGDPIMVPPGPLVVPPALETTAENMFQGANLIVSSLGSTTSRKVEPNYNLHKGKYKPIVAPYLASTSSIKMGSTTVTGSDTGWYLLAKNPAGGFSPLQVGYLRGQRAPVVERGEADFKNLGIAMRAFYDFGVALHDYRCGVFSAGQ